jgi:glucosamine-phosphate N-acetyltransferase
MLTTHSTHNMGIVAQIQDIAVARNQKGKKMGLRILEALVYAATESGAYKTVVHCAEANEAFHAQCGFMRDGSSMVLPLNRRPAPEPYALATQ